MLLCLHKGHAQIATYDVRLANLLHMQQGIGWPLHLNVAQGHEALMRLSEHLGNPQSCEVITPGGVTFNVRKPPNARLVSLRIILHIKPRLPRLRHVLKIVRLPSSII